MHYQLFIGWWPVSTRPSVGTGRILFQISSIQLHALCSHIPPFFSITSCPMFPYSTFLQYNFMPYVPIFHLSSIQLHALCSHIPPFFSITSCPMFPYSTFLQYNFMPYVPIFHLSSVQLHALCSHHGYHYHQVPTICLYHFHILYIFTFRSNVHHIIPDFCGQVSMAMPSRQKEVLHDVQKIR